MFTDEQRRTLIAIARRAVARRVSGAGAGEVPELPGLPEATGAFVTLKKHGELRGCIGTLECRDSLPREVARVAVGAAIDDPRFDPVRAAELGDLELEISVLGPLQQIDPHDPTAIEIGRHGLVVEQGRRRGLLLPQVAIEWGWDREQFLDQTCAKAGLARDCWRTGATVYRFDAEVFGG